MDDVSAFSDAVYYEDTPTRNAYETDAERFSAQVGDSDLARREAELASRESDVREREEQAFALQRANTANYPPFPSWFCIKPFVIHRISEEIPDSFKRQQKMYFIYFHFWMLLYFTNIISCSIQMTIANKETGNTAYPLEDPLVSLVLSIVYAIFVVPLGFYLRYWSLYRAITRGSSIRMILHLCAELTNIGWSGMMASGAWKTGGAGFEGAIALNSNGYPFAASWVFASAGLFMLDIMISIFCFFYFWYFWRRGGLNFSDAGAEAAAGIASNEAVQSAAFAGVKAGASRQI